MSQLIIALNPEHLVNADLDIRYTLPDCLGLVSAAMAGEIEDCPEVS